MNAVLRERLDAEITRKQFLQYSGILLLTIFGLGNFISIFGLHKEFISQASQGSDKTEHHGFGNSRFGV